MHHFNFLGSWLDVVARPSVHLTSQTDKRHAQLLSGVTFVITVLVLLQNVTIWDRYSPREALFWAFWGQFLFVFGVYLMSRTKYYRQAKTVLVGGLAILILLITMLETIEQTLLTPMLWMLFPILLAWVLAGTVEVVVITAATIISLLLLYFTNPALENEMPGMLIGILVTTALLLMLYKEQRERTVTIEKKYTESLLQLNRQLEVSLKQTNQQLQDEMEERIRIDRALREAQHIKTVGLMAGVLAHDFNNFLSAILLEAGNLQAKLEDSDTVQKICGVYLNRPNGQHFSPQNCLHTQKGVNHLRSSCSI